MMHLLENNFWQVGVLPNSGGSIAYARVQRAGAWHDFFRPTPEADTTDALKTASYPLIPWSNRIRDGKMTFQGVAYLMRADWPDGTAIHGVVREYALAVVSADEHHIRMTFDSLQHAAVNFPFAFSAWIEYRLEGNNFTTRVGVANADTSPMPAGFGTHPFLMRNLTSPTDVLSLEIPCSHAFPLVDCMPVGAPVPVEPRLDYQQLRPLGNVFVDDCLTNRTLGNPIRFVYPESNTHITHWMDHLYRNVIVYMPVDFPYIAVEPVTNTNDGFNMLAQGIADHHVFVLQPGEAREAMCGYILE